MLSNQWASEEKIREWNKKFNEALPFRHVVIDNAIEPILAEKLSLEFPSLEKMKVKYMGINESKSEHSDFENLDPSFASLKKAFSDEKIISAIEQISNIPSLITIHDRFGYGLHQGGKNSFLDIHVDYNLHPTQKKQRRLNLILFLNKEWKESWGGSLEFWNEDVSQCMQSIAPLFNRCVIFECNEISYHGYATITCPETESRKSFYHYYFSEPGKKLLFHDTIFKNKPQDRLSKKIIVRTKETAKNLIKRTFYHLGLNKFLK
jgi:Rps23 Pro-64 3,4-dihydroxylase Tpa1-like proline 4-hydroxylase